MVAFLKSSCLIEIDANIFMDKIILMSGICFNISVVARDKTDQLRVDNC